MSYKQKQASPPTEQTRGPVVADPTCTGCGQGVVEINLLIDGDELTMRSCANCDTRSWHRGGLPVNLGGVLADLSSSPTRYRRDLANR